MGKNKIYPQWQTFVLLLKKIAFQKSISQYEIAIKTKMRQTAVNRFFSATVCPRLDTFLKIIHALEINLTIKDKDKNISYEELMEQVQKELNY